MTAAGIQLPLIPEDDAQMAGAGWDRVPELTHYRDEGCRFWASCLSCPFPRCLFEAPGGPKQAIRALRDGEVRRLYAAGMPVLEIADQVGISRRSVYTALGGIRKQRRGQNSAIGARQRTKRRSHLPGRERLGARTGYPPQDERSRQHEPPVAAGTCADGQRTAAPLSPEPGLLSRPPVDGHAPATRATTHLQLRPGDCGQDHRVAESITLLRGSAKW